MYELSRCVALLEDDVPGEGDELLEAVVHAEGDGGGEDRQRLLYHAPRVLTVRLQEAVEHLNKSLSQHSTDSRMLKREKELV